MPTSIPGVLELSGPRAPAVPVVFDSPHSGCEYPDDFRPALPLAELRRGEDAFVDELFGAAPDHGAVALRALFPRTYIDPNRAPDDIDESLLEGAWPGGARPGPKVRLGIGLVPRRQVAGEVYDRKLPVAELRRRLEAFYWPYHHALEGALDDAHERWGSVWHVDCHSMPATSSEVSPEGPGVERPDFCIGDRDGTTCEPGLTCLVTEALREMGYRVSVNEPYKGVELVRRYSDPPLGRHSLQIEINRRLYMDEDRIERSPGFPALRADMTRLVSAICDYAARQVAPGEVAE